MSSQRTPRSGLDVLARGGILAIGGSITSSILGFVLLLIVARGLGSRGAGLLFEGIALFTVMSSLATFGADIGLVRVVSRYRALGQVREIRRTLIVALVPVLALGSVAAVLVAVFAPQLADVLIRGASKEQGETYIRILAPFIPVGGAMLVALSGTRGFGTFRPYVGIHNVGVPTARILVVSLAIGLGLGAPVIALGWAGPLAVGFILSVAALWRLVRTAESEPMTYEAGVPADPAGTFWRFAAPRGLAGFLLVSTLWLDVLLVGALSSTSEAGIYAAAARFVGVGTFALQAIGVAVAPQVSGLLARGERRDAQMLFQTATWWLMAPGWPVSFTMAVFAPLLMRWFGAEFVGGQHVLVILSLGLLVLLGTGNNKIVLLMAGKSAQNLLISALTLGTSLTLNLILIPVIGMEGAAIALATAIILDNAATTFALHRSVGLQPFGRGHLIVALGSLLCYGGVGLAVRGLMGPTLAAFLVASLVATLLYSMVLWRYRHALHINVLARALRRRRAAEADATPVLQV